MFRVVVIDILLFVVMFTVSDFMFVIFICHVYKSNYSHFVSKTGCCATVTLRSCFRDFQVAKLKLSSASKY